MVSRIVDRLRVILGKAGPVGVFAIFLTLCLFIITLLIHILNLHRELVIQGTRLELANTQIIAHQRENATLQREKETLQQEVRTLRLRVSDCEKRAPSPVSIPGPPSVVPHASTKPEAITITFVVIPAGEGGSSSRGDIAGQIVGLKKPEEYKIVIYALTDHWYIQPMTDSPFTDIGIDGRWANWTHLGHAYAAILVKPSYRPAFVTDVLPSTNDEVLAVATTRLK